MNKRIIELAEQAGLYHQLENGNIYPTILSAEESVLAYQNFAELIVADCAKIGELKEQGYSEYDPDISVGWYMRQQFGICRT